MRRYWYSTPEYFEQESQEWLKPDQWTKIQTDREWRGRVKNDEVQKEDHKVDILRKISILTSLELL